NECKFYSIQKSLDNFDPSECDASIKYAKEKGAIYRGHALFWPHYNPEWFKTYSTNVEDNKAVIIDYITKILDHYKDEESIAYWDVLNECVKDDSDGDHVNLRVGDNSADYYLGWDTYPEDIFTLAREHTNPNVKLCYNDYYNDGFNKTKTDAVYSFVKSLKQKDLVDCVGLQMHNSCEIAPNYDQLYEVISRYESIGVEVHLTEMDISMKKCKSYEDQRKFYNDAFKACFDHSNCKVYTLWGLYDAESWIGEKYE
ncbi:glycoside hydrolase family 10 protein, partial [Piromyces sp. E2]